MKVAIIGAGPSGITCCKTLREAGIDATCYEAGDRVGGQWVLGNSSGLSSAYDSLRTNTNRDMSRFTDFAFPDDYPEYPDHALMAAWFHRYAEHFDVLPHVKFETKVERLQKQAEGFLLGTATEETHYDAVVLAIGNLWSPVMPTFAGAFDGEMLHASDYFNPTTPIDCSGKRVMVVGIGNSGCEIAVELSEAAEVTLSARSSQTIMQRIKPGDMGPPHPGDDVMAPFNLLPVPVRDGLFRFLMPKIMARMAVSPETMAAVGLPSEKPDVFSKRSVVNDDIIDRLKAGALTARPDVKSIEGRNVVFVDGSTAEVDVIVCATGYRFSIPFAHPDLLGVEDEHDLALYQGIMHPAHHNLFVIGVVRALCSIWPLSEQQSKWISALLNGKFQLPAQSKIEMRAYPILKVPFSNCQFRAADLRREAGLT